MPTERSKELGTNKISRSVLLFVPHIASTQSNIACHFNPFCFEQGAAKLAPRGCTRKITPTLRSNSLAQWPALNRDLRSIFDSTVLFNITFVGGKPRSNIKNYSKKQYANTLVRGLCSAVGRRLELS